MYINPVTQRYTHLSENTSAMTECKNRRSKRLGQRGTRHSLNGCLVCTGECSYTRHSVGIGSAPLPVPFAALPPPLPMPFAALPPFEPERGKQKKLNPNTLAQKKSPIDHLNPITTNKPCSPASRLPHPGLNTPVKQ